ncbi:MAG: extracellular solute-binding protein [Clostridia bacterium]|nr:extracellular solute-binding protein [Clostridia bacterium]
MKTKIFIYLLLISMIFSSCQKSDEENAEKADLQGNEPLVTFIDDGTKSYNHIEYLDIFLYSENEDMLSEEEQQTWSDYLKKEIDINANLYYGLKEDGVFIDGPEMNKTNYSGIFVNNVEMNVQMAKAQLFQNIEDYMDISKYPDEVTSMIQDKEGHVLILPTSHIRTYQYRTYNKEVLEELNAKVPATIEEFYQLAKKIGEKNRNSDRKTYIATFNNIYILDDLADIFIAFGLYPNKKLLSYADSSIGLNPTTNQFEYMMNNENLEEALEFIKLLYDEGLLYESSTNNYTDDVDIVSYLSDKNNFSYEKNSYGFYLEGTNKNQLIYCSDSVEGFSFLKNTEDTEAIISLFENKIFPDTKAQLSFQYGIEGDAYYITDDVLYINQNSSIKKPGIVINWYKPFINVMYAVDGQVIEKEKTPDEMANETMNILNDNLYCPDIYFDFYTYSTSNKGFSSMISKANMQFNMLVLDVLNGSGISSSIEFYRGKTQNDLNMDDFNEFLKTEQ